MVQKRALEGEKRKWRKMDGCTDKNQTHTSYTENMPFYIALWKRPMTLRLAL
jgi:hypothetical protein